MLGPAVLFVQVILALHIIFAILAFGAVFAVPLLLGVGGGSSVAPSAIPGLLRLQQSIGRWLLSPGLLLVLVFGAILASKDHAWKLFYVQWGIGAIIVIGGLEGALLIPRAGRLAQVAERDLAAAGTGGPAWSADYLALRRGLLLAAAAIGAIVVVTVYLMVVQAN